MITESSANDSKLNVEIAKKSNSKILYVASINEDLDSIIKYYGESLGGIVLNKIPRYRYEEVVNKYSSLPFLGYIPDNRYFVSNTVDQIAEHLDGEYVFDGDGKDNLILNVLIGGIVLDWSVHYYSSKENVIALIRGDRPDLQLGAMQSGGNVKSIVLTKGIKPIEYVVYEAKKQEIPLISVKSNTHETAQMISKLVGKSKIYNTFWEPFTLAVMNTSPKYASAKVLSKVLKETVFKGKKNCLIYQPKENWGKSLIDPALKFIKKQNVKIKSKFFFKKLNEIQANYSNVIEEVRGKGLLIGLKLRVDQTKFINKLFENKLLTIKAADNVVRILPPLNVSNKEITIALKIIEKVCKSYN